MSSIFIFPPDNIFARTADNNINVVQKLNFKFLIDTLDICHD